MPLTNLIATIAIAAALALVFIALVRLGMTLINHRTLRKAVESNPELAASLVERLVARRDNSGDDRLAMVLIAIGVAMAAAAAIAVDDPGDIRAAVAAALFPLLVGGALWFRSRAARRAARRDGAE